MIKSNLYKGLFGFMVPEGDSIMIEEAWQKEQEAERPQFNHTQEA